MGIYGKGDESESESDKGTMSDTLRGIEIHKRFWTQLLHAHTSSTSMVPDRDKRGRCNKQRGQ